MHYDGDPIRRPAYLDAIARGAIPDGYGADDGVGLLFEDAELVRIVASRPGTHAYRVQRQTGDGAQTVLETLLEPELLAAVRERALARRARGHPRVSRRALRRRGAAALTRAGARAGVRRPAQPASPDSVASSERAPPRSRCSQR